MVVPKSGSVTDWRYPGFANGDVVFLLTPSTSAQDAAATTETVAFPDLRLLVAVTVASPGVNAVTTPADETVATAGIELCQLTLLLEMMFPDVVRTVAVSCAVFDTARDTESGETTTELTTSVESSCGAALSA